MGSIESPTAENNSDAVMTEAGGDRPPPPPETEAMKRRRANMLPLEVGTRVMCRWRDGKYHPVKVIERRKVSVYGLAEYEYYVHYTECKNFLQLPVISQNHRI